MTKEAEEGWPKEKRPRPKLAKYGGMSVKEIYEALEHRERLIEAYKEKQEECQKLKDAFHKSTDYIFEIAMQYYDTAHAADDLADRLDFLSRSSGMLEAFRHLRKIFNSEGTDEGKE